MDTEEGRFFRWAMEDEWSPPRRRPRRRRRRRPAIWEPDPPASWSHGWLELYRDGRQVAIWCDFLALDLYLATADPSRSFHAIWRSPSGEVVARYLVRLRGKEPADYIPVKLKPEEAPDDGLRG